MEIIDRNLNDFYYGGPYPKKYPVGIEKVLMRKLQMIDAAAELEDLRVPPGNHLERLKGNLSGHFSIRINSQWRIVFLWSEKQKEAYDVRLEDYHR